MLAAPPAAPGGDGKGKLEVISRMGEVGEERPRSEPVTRRGEASVQCLIILRTVKVRVRIDERQESERRDSQ